jgi:hypothetical protein
VPQDTHALGAAVPDEGAGPKLVQQAPSASRSGCRWGIFTRAADRIEPESVGAGDMPAPRLHAGRRRGGDRGRSGGERATNYGVRSAVLLLTKMLRPTNPPPTAPTLESGLRQAAAPHLVMEPEGPGGSVAAGHRWRQGIGGGRASVDKEHGALLERGSRPSTINQPDSTHIERLLSGLHDEDSNLPVHSRPLWR